MNQGQLDPNSVRTLWLDHLPRQVQVALATATALDNAAIAQLADRVWEIHQASDNRLMAVSAITAKDNAARTEKPKTLEETVQELVRKMNKILKTQNRSRSQYRSRSRSREQASAENKKDNDKYCYYHNKYGKKAQKCKEPCEFPKTQEN